MFARITLEETLEKRTPRCAICLVIAGVVAHGLAFLGNLNVASTVQDFGHSADGWSNVGLGFADSLAEDLDRRLINTSIALIQTIGALDDLRAQLSNLSMSGPESWENQSLLQLPEGHDVLADKFEQLVSLLSPALHQVQQWLVSFGPKLKLGANELMSALDMVQKILDTATSNLNSMTGNVSTEAEELLLRDAFNLFDVSNTGAITREDLKSVAAMYGVRALEGEKADNLSDRYERRADTKPGISPEEFRRLTEDTELPGVLSLVVRTYTRRLARTSKQISSARTRSEVSESVTGYLALVTVENNASKIQSVVGPLTNGSLPLEFTADVLAQLAIAADKPDKLTTVDIGALAVNTMVALSAERVVKAADLLSSAEFWTNEGFDPSDQSSCLDRVARWIANTTHGHAAGELWLSLLTSSQGSEVNAAHVAREDQLDAEISDEGALMQYHEQVRWASGRTAGVSRESSEDSCVQQGLPTDTAGCAEETEDGSLLQHSSGHARARGYMMMQEKMELHKDPMASSRAERLHSQLHPRWERLCIAAARRVQSTQRELDRRRVSEQARLAKQRQLIVESGHPLSFIADALISSSSSPDSKRVVSAGVQARPETLSFAASLARSAKEQVKRYENLCFDYSAASSGTMESAAEVVEGMIKRFSGFLEMVEKYASPRALHRLEVGCHRIVQALRSGNLSGVALNEEQGEPDMWGQTVDLIKRVDEMLPTWIDALEKARADTIAASATLESLFGIVRSKAPPIFFLVSQHFVKVMTWYFVFFVALCLVNLAYVLWASRYAERGTPGCASCCRVCDDHECCFWFALFVMETLWLVLFLAAAVMLILFGVRAFIGAGCKPIYLLGDQHVCGERLSMVGHFLQNHSWAFGEEFDDLGPQCNDNKLLMCQMIREQLYSSMMLAALGNAMAASITWLLIVESARLHERRHHLLTFEAAKDSEY